MNSTLGQNSTLEDDDENNNNTNNDDDLEVYIPQQEDTSCSCTKATSRSTTSSKCIEEDVRRSPITRIAISAEDSRWIEPYLAAYNAYLEHGKIEMTGNVSSTAITSRTTTTTTTTTTMASKIQLSILPSIDALYDDIRHDLKSQRGLYAGFFIPPTLMGDFIALDGLTKLSLSSSKQDLNEYWKDLLPYYKNHISKWNGNIYGLPFRGGNQPLLMYRKDYLDALQLQVPVTWGDYIRVASTFSALDSNNNNNETTTTADTNSTAPTTNTIFGSCLGRMSHSRCTRQRNQQQASDATNGESPTCQSMSQTYIGMMLASMTQHEGSSSGWLFDLTDERSQNPWLNSDGNNNNNNNNKKERFTMTPLSTPALESTLIFMEQQLKYGAPDELLSDSNMNMELFRRGNCAMTIVLDHPVELFSDPDIGFAPIPGAHTFLDRSKSTIVDCTKTSCPYGEAHEEWGTINHAPYGSDDRMMVGSISNFASQTAQDEVYDFFNFITQLQDDEESVFGLGESRQPLTHSDLEKSTVEGYADILRTLTESKNSAVPLRIPRSHTLLSEIDDQVYEYLLMGDYNPLTRRRVQDRVEASLQRMIRQYDTIHRWEDPMSVSYEKSLGIFLPSRPVDVHIRRVDRWIGWSLGGVTCLCSVFFFFWVWRNKDTSVVRGSQELFLNLVCVGTFLIGCCIFLFGIYDESSSTEIAGRTCMGTMWLYSFGYVILVTALYSKIGLVNRVFRKAKNLHRIRIGWVDVLRPFSILGGLNLLVLTTWSIHDPARWELVPVKASEYSKDLDSDTFFGVCNCVNFRFYIGVAVAINYGFSLVALIQAYECRMLSTDYLESIWISASLAGIVQVWTVGLPLLKLLDNDPRGLFYAKIGVAFFTAMLPLLLIFLPKIDYLRECNSNPDHGKEQVAGTAAGDHSITSRDSEESPTKVRRNAADGMPEQTTTNGKKGTTNQKLITSPKGIRIIQTSIRHVAEVEKIQRSLRVAESRNRSLNERLERLQEKFEHYIVMRNIPHQDFDDYSNSSNNFILAARSESVVPMPNLGRSQS